ncbi:hypothetical protein ACGFZQ_39275 [Streptomyces sp. NPDC048254]|uniref:hypothetical protein n=1 Tax=Streptomyces sp. NPDC048254 TaxID=3365525 RepID=UPI0037189C92
MSADAVEIHRDLNLPAAALRWNAQATPMSASDYTRSVGLRMTVLATAHLQRGDLDRALAGGQRAVVILGNVRSARATDYLTSVVRAMAPLAQRPASRRPLPPRRPSHRRQHNQAPLTVP